MRHLLHPLRRNQGYQARTDRNGHDVQVELVGLEIDSREDTNTGCRHHAKHHQSRTTQYKQGDRFHQCAQLGQQAQNDHDDAPGHTNEAAAHTRHTHQAHVLREAGVREGVKDAANQRTQAIGAQACRELGLVKRLARDV